MLDVELLGIHGGFDQFHIFRFIDGHGGQILQSLGHHTHQLPGALGRTGRDLIEFATGSLYVLPQTLQIVGLGIQQIDLVGGYDHGTVGKVYRIVFQLSADGIEVSNGIPILAAGNIDHVDEQTATVDMAQEIVTQTGAFCSAFNDAGDVCHNEGNAFVNINHAQIGEQSGEVVVGDLGTGVGGDGQQGGLTHIGEANQTHVCQQLQLHNDIPLLTLQACLGKPGDLTGGGGIMGVTPAAAAALGDDVIFAGGHIHEDRVGLRIPDDGAAGDLNNEIFATLAAHIAALAVFASLGGILALIAEVQQGGHMVGDPQDDATAVAAITTVGTAGIDIFFPVESHSAVTAATADHRDSYFIYKHSKSSFVKE